MIKNNKESKLELFILLILSVILAVIIIKVLLINDIAIILTSDIPNNVKIIYEPIGYIIGSYYSLFIFLILGIVGLCLKIRKNITLSIEQQVKIRRLIYISCGIFFLFGMLINRLNYHLVIEKHNLLKCPPEIGYKKNLADTYVTDLKYCKK